MDPVKNIPVSFVIRINTYGTPNLDGKPGKVYNALDRLGIINHRTFPEKYRTCELFANITVHGKYVIDVRSDGSFYSDDIKMHTNGVYNILHRLDGVVSVGLLAPDKTRERIRLTFVHIKSGCAYINNVDAL